MNFDRRASLMFNGFIYFSIIDFLYELVYILIWKQFIYENLWFIVIDS